MSEVIEDYIRRNPGVGEDAAFQGFLQQERIKAWVGSDETRRERLRREFRRVWGVVHAPPPATGPSQPQSPSSSPESAAAPPRQAALVREVKSESPAAKPAEARAAPASPSARAPPPSPSSAPASAERPAPARLQTGPPRRLQVLCATCARMDVWLQGGDIACRQCGRAYDDMLQLVPVKTVGPFAYLFGEGAGGWLTAGGMAAALLAIYALLRWL